MYNITKLSSEAQSFLTQVSSSGRSRSPMAAMALARFIASRFALPSAPVEDPEHYYRLQCEIDAQKCVNLINELTPVDCTQALDLARRFYQLRYAMLFPQHYVFSFRENHYVEDFFGINRVFSDDTIEFIKSNGGDLAYYCNGFRRMIDDIEFAEKLVDQGHISTMSTDGGVAG